MGIQPASTHTSNPKRKNHDTRKRRGFPWLENVLCERDYTIGTLNQNVVVLFSLATPRRMPICFERTAAVVRPTPK
ncbi:MAG: hypothetical protein ACI9UA_004582 [Pseudoalteromonas tetraodonis]|jgi:hypothetical protein